MVPNIAVLADCHAVAQQLLGPDGSFPDWINIAPVGVLGGATVLEIDCAERLTSQLLVGDLALPFEPFHLLGPSLPPEYQDGDPLPKVALPDLST